MDTFLRFLYEFLAQFFNGIKFIVLGIVNGFISIFNVPEYIRVIDEYKDDLSMPEWLLVGLAILTTLIMLGLIIAAIYFLIRKYIRVRKTLVDQESLLDEVGTLNNEVAKLVQEKQTILAMKVSQLGLKPGESATEETSESSDNVDPNTEIRFAKLHDVDVKYENVLDVSSILTGSTNMYSKPIIMGFFNTINFNGRIFFIRYIFSSINIFKF